MVACVKARVRFHWESYQKARMVSGESVVSAFRRRCGALLVHPVTKRHPGAIAKLLKSRFRDFGQTHATRSSVPIAKITSQGLFAIALLVAALWACILAENAITRTARADAADSLQELRRLRFHRVDAPQPHPLWEHPGRV